MFVSAKDSIGKGHRSALVLGAKATGKTTFVVSASKHAPDVLPAPTMVECPDVAIIQFDAESVLGAYNANLNPQVIDLAGSVGWPAMSQALAKAIAFLKPLVEKGEIRVVGIDLGSIDKEVRAWASGSTPGQLDKGQLVGDLTAAASGKDTNWPQVSAQGLSVYRALRNLPCLVVGMAHLKAANNNPFAGKEPETASINRDIRSFGGESAKTAPDLAAGVLGPWMANASFVFAREARSVNKGTPIKPQWVQEYVTHTGGNDMFEAGNRASAKIALTETRPLRVILESVYK